jgi:glucose/arabinose dehydrogenase
VRRAALLALVAALLLAGCDGDSEEQGTGAAEAPPTEERTATQAQPAADEPVRAQGGPRTSSWVEGLETPWELAFLPDGRALVTERPGRVRLIERGGRLRREPAAEVEVAELGEGGLLGMALDPSFRRNRFVYLYRTTQGGNEVLRYRLRGNRLVDETVLVRGIQAAAIHDGGRLRVGPDDRLYFSTGDAGQDSLAQDRGSLNGKILRLSPSRYRGRGGRPEVFTLGHRNPQGFDWQPRTDRMVQDEHGAAGNDEVNVLRRGGNYGWPDVEGEENRAGFIAPVAVYPESIAPSGATFVHRSGSEWTGDYLIGALVGEQIRRVGFSGGRVTTNEPLFEGRFGRIRTVVEGPDGALYALTSNRDGRGSPRRGDDRIVRIVPPAG